MKATDLGPIDIDRMSPVPMARQLYEAIRAAILDGRLAAGLRLPSTRTLAADLDLARNTVLAAFEQLVAEGYVEARAGAGSRVAAFAPETLSAVRPMVRAGTPKETALTLSRRGRVLASPIRRLGPNATAFQPGLPALDRFPREDWARALARASRAAPDESLGYRHTTGLPALRAAIAAHVGATRGVRAEPDQVVMVAGAQAGLELVARMATDPGDDVWVEDPGYLGARAAFEAAGARPVPVPVDAEGMMVAGGRGTPRLVYVTPSHQYPLGVTMSLPRRLALLEAARAAGAWVLEDDYDSEIRHAGRPLNSLQGLDRSGRVIYMGTFAKTMFPGLRLGFLIVPPGLVDAFAQALRHTGQNGTLAPQAALATFIEEGLFGSHVRRMRSLYAQRQQALVDALRLRLGGLVDVTPASTGMQLAAYLDGRMDDRVASRAAADAGIVAHPLSAYWLGTPTRGGLHLGFAAVPEAEMAPTVARLARALEGAAARRAS
jgi:GntR family transcriptional regulator/MocR family aminotransferase